MNIFKDVYTSNTFIDGINLSPNKQRTHLPEGDQTWEETTAIISMQLNQFLTF